MGKPTSPRLVAEQRKIVVAFIAAVMVCAVMLLGGYSVLPLFFRFPTELSERLAFAIQADVFVLLWVFIAARMVSRGRFHSAADIGGSAAGPPSPVIANQAAFLQNTLEQAVTPSVRTLPLRLCLSGPALALIVAAIALFAIGRMTFLWGNPKGAGARAFGMATTAAPTIAGYGLSC